MISGRNLALGAEHALEADEMRPRTGNQRGESLAGMGWRWNLDIMRPTMAPDHTPETRPSLHALEQRGDFIRRHIGPDPRQIGDMLGTLDLATLEALLDQAVPASIRVTEPLALAEAMSERETVSYLRRMRDRNRVFISMLGMGYYGTVVPAVIRRNVLENPGWYTAYTPYQAEVSQGRLEALLNFQQMVIDLSGMEIANASLLDEATAAAEAMAMARRLTDSDAAVFFADRDCHPQTLAVLKTRARPLGIEVEIGDAERELAKLVGNKTDGSSVYCCSIPGPAGRCATSSQ